ncbi:MAG: hypothetical protein JNM75_14610 [Rhodospirillales bacterium]|nr:hypothetical protein [Rhodospirillales bacterium]
MDTVLESLPRRPAQRRVFVPLETSPEQSLRLRADGWITVHAVENVGDVDVEAARLRCGHVVDGETVREVRTQQRAGEHG